MYGNSPARTFKEFITLIHVTNLLDLVAYWVMLDHRAIDDTSSLELLFSDSIAILTIFNTEIHSKFPGSFSCAKTLSNKSPRR